MSAKRFVLKPYARPDAMSQHTAMETFSMLQQAILKIYAQEQSTLTYEELYRAAYLMVLHKHGDLLYNGVLETVKRHLAKLADGIRKAPDDAMLARLNEAWSVHTREMTMVRDILMYMDKSYVPPARKLLSYDAGTLAFRETVARDPAIRARMLRLVLGSVAAARGGAALDAPLLRGIVGMLVSLGISSVSVYTEDLEGPLLEEAGATAKAETAAYLAAHSAPEYLEHAEKRLRAEVATAREFVHPSTLPKLEVVLHRVLIADHAVALLDKEGSGLVQLLERDAMADLSRMYRLFGLPRGAVAWKDRSGTTRSVPPLVALRDAMKGLITERCRALVRDPEAQKDPSLYIRRLCELREKFVAIVESPFRGDKEFARAAKESFELVLNERGDSTTSEYLSLFLDDHFRGGFKGMSDAAVDEVLNSAIAVFRFLSNKDEFEAWYKAHLQKRLLSNKVGSDDAERLMISKLKTECGFAYTTKLEGMFTDIKTSSDFMERYKRERIPPPLVPGAARPVDLDVTVLTMVNWPAVKLQPCRLPPQVAAAGEAFRTFYLACHTGRRLTWHTDKGTADVVFTPAPGRRHELTVSTYQMVVLTLFNAAERVPFSRMVESVGVPAEDLGRHVLSLLNPKVPVLRRTGGGGASATSLDGADVLSVNTDFASKMLRIRVPLISAKSAATASAGGGKGAGGAAADEDGDIAAQLETQRKSMLDAAIVRIMKARRTLDYANLVAEVTRQLSSRFVPAPQDVKKRVEDLIEREYLERDAGDKKLYSYVA